MFCLRVKSFLGIIHKRHSWCVEIFLEIFINLYLWTIETAENVKNTNKYWATNREAK